MVKIRKSILIVIVFLISGSVYSQKIAIKSNVLYDITSTINLGAEFRLTDKTTLDISGSYNPWTINSSTNSKSKFVLIQPEFRYWKGKSFNGHFFGAHVHYAFYNVGGDNWLTNYSNIFSKNDVGKSRYQGFLAGAGFSYGYHWIIGKRWGLEANMGFGYAYLSNQKHDIFGCFDHVNMKTETRHYFGPTKLGLSLIFLIK